jgi:hypothetical protein
MAPPPIFANTHYVWDEARSRYTASVQNTKTKWLMIQMYAGRRDADPSTMKGGRKHQLCQEPTNRAADVEQVDSNIISSARYQSNEIENETHRNVSWPHTPPSS